MNRLKLLGALAVAALATACVTPVGPVEVTRFHVPEVQTMARGAITVVPAQGIDPASLEFRTYAAAVERELQRLGFTGTDIGPAGTGDAPVAVLAVGRNLFRPERARGPVSVGVGGSTGSYGSGVGLGVGIDLSGKPPEQVQTFLSVMIRRGVDGPTLWEGRATFAVSGKSPLADTNLGAAKMAEALFRDFPGESGKTVLVE